MKLSIIVPCYNEEKALPLFYTETTAVLRSIGEDYELVLVDDGSHDATAEVMKGLSRADAHVSYILLSRNFGKEAAMLAGLQSAEGDLFALMDADLQHPPALLKDMYTAITKEGYDSAATRRVNRAGEPRIRSMCARMFYHLSQELSGMDIVDGAGDYRMMNRTMRDAVLSVTECNRFSKGIFAWVGFRTKWLEYENIKRAAGETKWSFHTLFQYALEGLFAFSTKPLRFASISGIILSVMAVLLYLGIMIYSAFAGTYNASAVLVPLILLLCGVQLFALGIFGEYLARAYLEVKHRPIYITKESNIHDNNAQKPHTSSLSG